VLLRLLAVDRGQIIDKRMTEGVVARAENVRARTRMLLRSQDINRGDLLVGGPIISTKT
jgi:hypothetical protein